MSLWLKLCTGQKFPCFIYTKMLTLFTFQHTTLNNILKWISQYLFRLDIFLLHLIKQTDIIYVCIYSLSVPCYDANILKSFLFGCLQQLCMQLCRQKICVSHFQESDKIFKYCYKTFIETVNLMGFHALLICQGVTLSTLLPGQGSESLGAQIFCRYYKDIVQIYCRYSVDIVQILR